jgi:hypothetical protein
MPGASPQTHCNSREAGGGEGCEVGCSCRRETGQGEACPLSPTLGTTDCCAPRTLKAAMETAKPFVDDAMQTYDEMIELVCCTDVGKN